MAVSKRQAEAHRITVAIDAVRENITTTDGTSIRVAWARHFGFKDDVDPKYTIEAMRGLVQELTR